MSDIAAFLAARLDEDEAAAKALSGEQWEVIKNEDFDYSVCVRPEPLLIEGRADTWREDMAEWAARHDPARVLREVEAKRKIIAEWQASQQGVHEPFVAGLEYAIMCLATVYSDHPDYDPGWKP